MKIAKLIGLCVVGLMITLNCRAELCVTTVPLTTAPTTTATLCGHLCGDDGGTLTATIYWGDNNGGATTTAWDTTVDIGGVGSTTNFCTDISGLQTGRTYFFTARARAISGTTTNYAWGIVTRIVAQRPARTDLEVTAGGEIYRPIDFLISNKTALVATLTTNWNADISSTNNATVLKIQGATNTTAQATFSVGKVQNLSAGGITNLIAGATNTTAQATFNNVGAILGLTPVGVTNLISGATNTTAQATFANVGAILGLTPVNITNLIAGATNTTAQATFNNVGAILGLTPVGVTNLISGATNTTAQGTWTAIGSMLGLTPVGVTNLISGATNGTAQATWTGVGGIEGLTAIGVTNLIAGATNGMVSAVNSNLYFVAIDGTNTMYITNGIIRGFATGLY